MCGITLVSNSENVDPSSLVHRGPDQTVEMPIGGFHFIFNRLSIVDLTNAGGQPFDNENIVLMCNGEIYNSEDLRKEYKDYDYVSESDCEVLLPLFSSLPVEEACNKLDAEFALVAYNKKTKSLIAARDPLGIRPLFMGFDKDNNVNFASEVKALKDFCDEIVPFPPGFYFCNGVLNPYIDVTAVEEFIDEGDACEGIENLLIAAVEKRLIADAKIGFLLSGGLDSSLVCSIASQLSSEPIKTFAIGMKKDAIDIKYAQQVADFIGSDHTEVFITEQDAINSLDELIFYLETWDITTIRAAVGMFLVCEYINKNTDIKVLLTGEVSDELFGYKYTDYAPSEKEFQKEAEKRIKEIYMYDVLRADRSISAHSLEARVPFSDKEFVKHVMSIHPSLKMNTTNKGKYLLRKAFEDKKYLPKEILWREKAAFSDAVGHSLVDCIKHHAEQKYSDEDVANAKSKYPIKTPFTKESLLYRDIFEKYYPDRVNLIKDFWMPNKSWPNCDVKDPSARVLKNYGGSGK